MTTTTTAPPAPAPSFTPPSAAELERLVARRSFLTLATASAAGRPHAAGVLYAADGLTLYVSTMLDSRKARNVAATGHAAATIAVRRMPFGAPPSSIQFQADAEVLALDDPDVTRLAAAGTLAAVTGHGELELPGGCFLRLRPRARIHTYGLGMSLLHLARHPLEAAATVELVR